MKKSLKLLGLLSVLLIAGMMFAACSDGGGDGDEDNGPSPGSLPSLPANDPSIAYVSTEAEARALLTTALRSILRSVDNMVEDLIEDKISFTANGGSWNITNDTSISGVKVSSKGSFTESDFMDDDWEPSKGENGRDSSSNDTTVELTGNKEASGFVIYSGSRVEQKEQYSVSYNVTDISSSGLTIRMSGSNDETTAYAMTVSSGGKGGKIILNARQSATLPDSSYTFTSYDDFPDVPVKYSGSLTVYGEDDEELYKLPIANDETYYEAMSYFD
jgi:hypothetical protein